MPIGHEIGPTAAERRTRLHACMEITFVAAIGCFDHDDLKECDEVVAVTRQQAFAKSTLNETICRGVVVFAEESMQIPCSGL